MQAWGVQSHGENRDTALEPSKSGVIGLLCAALGRDRAEPLDDLCALRMGVRVDREGRIHSDFQTIHKRTVDGSPIGNGSISTRFYLSGAVFLVGLEGDPALLQSLDGALQSPHWMLFLGRKAFPPAVPIWLTNGLRKGMSLEEALRTYPWLLDDPALRFSLKVDEKIPDRPEWLRTMLEDLHGELIRPDVPVSFAARTFHSRRVHMSRLPTPPASIDQKPKEAV